MTPCEILLQKPKLPSFLCSCSRPLVSLLFSSHRIFHIPSQSNHTKENTTTRQTISILVSTRNILLCQLPRIKAEQPTTATPVPATPPHLTPTLSPSTITFLRPIHRQNNPRSSCVLPLLRLAFILSPPAIHPSKVSLPSCSYAPPHLYHVSPLLHPRARLLSPFIPFAPLTYLHYHIPHIRITFTALRTHTQSRSIIKTSLFIQPSSETDRFHLIQRVSPIPLQHPMTMPISWLRKSKQLTWPSSQ